MASRLTLAAEYGSILWYVRKYKSSILPMALMVGLNLIAAIIYLGVAFGFRDGDSKLYVIWFVMAGIETIISVAFSLKWKVLSFYGTHLVSRMSLLTYIFMGEGIVTVLSAVSKIVLNANSWSTFPLLSVKKLVAS